MELTFQYWYMLPISIVVATIAMSSGIGGAVFFSPIFILALKLEPAEAIGAALLTELFGFTSGLIAYMKARLIDYKLGMNLLIFSVPATIVGAIFADKFPPVALKAIFATGIIFIGYQLFVSWRNEQKEKMDENIKKEFENNYESCLVDREGNSYKYTVCNKNMGRAFAALGGAFLGMISVGLAELQEYHLVAKCKVPSRVAVATAIFVVVITVLVAAIGHAYKFAVAADTNTIQKVVNLVLFTAPGVLIGGQLGPLLQKRLNPDHVKVAISILFVSVGILMLASLNK